MTLSDFCTLDTLHLSHMSLLVAPKERAQHTVPLKPNKVSSSSNELFREFALKDFSLFLFFTNNAHLLETHSHGASAKSSRNNTATTTTCHNLERFRDPHAPWAFIRRHPRVREIKHDGLHIALLEQHRAPMEQGKNLTAVCACLTSSRRLLKAKRLFPW